MQMVFMKETANIFTKPIEEYQNAREQNQKLLSATPSANGSPRASTDTLHHTPTGSRSASPMRAKTGGQIAGAMAGASARSLGNALGKPAKSIFIDVPLAVADGLHNVPNLYGSKVTERGKISDFKSGAMVAGKSFVTGIAGGIAGLVVEPYKGGRKEGALGVAKGLGKGSLGFLTKTGSGE